MNNDFPISARKEIARILYTQNNRTIRETADDVMVDEATVRAWINEGSWDLVRRSLLISKDAQLSHLYDAVEQLNDRMQNGQSAAKDMDQLLKYTTAIKNLDTDNSVYSLIECAELFIAWLYHRNRALSQTVTRQFEVFIKERRNAA